MEAKYIHNKDNKSYHDIMEQKQNPKQNKIQTSKESVFCISVTQNMQII
jgi:hypothetical protein